MDEKRQRETHSLWPLGQLTDLEVADENPDVRGWDVLGRDGEKLGEVEELIVEPDAMKVRYLAVELDKEVLGKDAEDRQVLIPIGIAALDEEEDRVSAPRFSAADAKRLPAYTGGPVSRDDERSLRRTLEPGARGDERERDFYGHGFYDEDRFYAPRRGKVVVTRTVIRRRAESNP